MLLADRRPAEAVPHLRFGTEDPCQSWAARRLMIVALDAAGDRSSACTEARRIKFTKFDTDPLSKEVIRRTADCPVK